MIKHASLCRKTATVAISQAKTIEVLVCGKKYQVTRNSGTNCYMLVNTEACAIQCLSQSGLISVPDQQERITTHCYRITGPSFDIPYLHS